MRAEAKAPRVQELLRDIAAGRQPRGTSSLSHEQCQTALEFYIDSALQGEDVRALYPVVWQHLQTCEACRRSFDVVTESMRDVPISAQPPERGLDLALTLPFVTSRNEASPCTQGVRSRIGGKALGFSLTVPPVHFQKLFGTPSLAAGLRGQASSSGRSLLLFDTITLGRREIDVELWAQPMKRGTVRLEVTVTCPIPLPDPLRVSLKWDHHQASASIRRGRALFTGIPVSDLEQVNNLRIEFEAGPRSSPPKGPHGSNG